MLLVGFFMEKCSAAHSGRRPTGAVFHGEISGGLLGIFSSLFHIPLWVACRRRWTADLTANSWKHLVVGASSSSERSSVWWWRPMRWWRRSREVAQYFIPTALPVVAPGSLAKDKLVGLQGGPKQESSVWPTEKYLLGLVKVEWGSFKALWL